MQLLPILQNFNVLVTIMSPYKDSLISASQHFYEVGTHILNAQIRNLIRTRDVK